MHRAKFFIFDGQPRRKKTPGDDDLIWPKTKCFFIYIYISFNPIAVATESLLLLLWSCSFFFEPNFIRYETEQRVDHRIANAVIIAPWIGKHIPSFRVVRFLVYLFMRFWGVGIRTKKDATQRSSHEILI